MLRRFWLEVDDPCRALLAVGGSLFRSVLFQTLFQVSFPYEDHVNACGLIGFCRQVYRTGTTGKVGNLFRFQGIMAYRGLLAFSLSSFTNIPFSIGGVSLRRINLARSSYFLVVSKDDWAKAYAVPTLAKAEMCTWSLHIPKTLSRSLRCFLARGFFVPHIQLLRQWRSPPELKHILKGRKRNQLRFP